MSDILAALPGTPMRVAEVMPALAKYWQDSAKAGTSTRASQMNLVVIFGKAVSPESAAEQLGHAYALSRRYPCRVVVLCPSAEAGMTGKLDIVCYLSERNSVRRCGEVLTLGFPGDAGSAMLESQLSVWLESDLPAYVWLHGVSSAEAAGYAPLLRSARRVVYDSAVCGDAVGEQFPRAEIVSDLAVARLLSVRQALGQFLCAYRPADLVRGLESVSITHAPALAGEAKRLAQWMRERLEASAAPAGLSPTVVFRVGVMSDCEACLATEWRYAGGGSFKWEHAAQGSGSRLVADIAGKAYSYPLRVPFLDPVAALREALFY